MSTTAVSSSTPGNQLAGSNKLASLKPTDFIKMMLTQLQNQDPLQPEQSDALLSQMSQIGQLQSSTDTQTAMQGLTLQSQIGSASALIGKTVSGLDTNSNPVTGVVNSVKVTSAGANLELDTGAELGLSNVTTIAAAPSGTTAATAASTAPASGVAA